mgnify:CR=1 FL=1
MLLSNCPGSQPLVSPKPASDPADVKQLVCATNSDFHHKGSGQRERFVGTGGLAFGWRTVAGLRVSPMRLPVATLVTIAPIKRFSLSHRFTDWPNSCAAFVVDSRLYSYSDFWSYRSHCRPIRDKPYPHSPYSARWTRTGLSLIAAIW